MRMHNSHAYIGPYRCQKSPGISHVAGVIHMQSMAAAAASAAVTSDGNYADCNDITCQQGCGEGSSWDTRQIHAGNSDGHLLPRGWGGFLLWVHTGHQQPQHAQRSLA